jgi:chemotaxis protein CheD
VTLPAYDLARSAATPDGARTPVYVHPGRIAATAGADSFTTVVGSGAAVCVWDPAHRVGGMAHFLLPESGSAPAAPRYGDVALKALLEQLAALGGRSYRATVHGGSAPPIVSESGHLGDRNVAAALAFLSLRGIMVVSRDVGGAGARKLVFDPAQGVVQVARVGA